MSHSVMIRRGDPTEIITTHPEEKVMANDVAIGTGDSDKAMPHVREAMDAGDHAGLRADPTDEDAKVDVALDSTFPTSDAPAHTRPGSNEPAPSSGYDEKAERALARKAAWQSFGRNLRTPLLIGGGALATAGLALLVIWRRGRADLDL